jgi:hypothetical protein
MFLGTSQPTHLFPGSPQGSQFLPNLPQTCNFNGDGGSGGGGGGRVTGGGGGRAIGGGGWGGKVTGGGVGGCLTRPGLPEELLAKWTINPIAMPATQHPTTIKAANLRKIRTDAESPIRQRKLQHRGQASGRPSPSGLGLGPLPDSGRRLGSSTARPSLRSRRIVAMMSRRAARGPSRNSVSGVEVGMCDVPGATGSIAGLSFRWFCVAAKGFPAVPSWRSGLECGGLTPCERLSKQTAPVG